MSTLPFYRRPITGRTVVRVVMTPVLVVGIPFLFLHAWSARPLRVASEFAVSTPPVPTPNAHSLYELANHDMRAKGRPTPPALVIDYDADQEAVEDPKKYPLSGKIAWVESQRPALAVFERALQAEYLYPPVRSAQPGGDITEPIWLRWLARSVTVECQVLAATGLNEKAVNRAVDIWKMSLDARRGAPLTVALNAFAAEIYARRAIDGEIAHLNGAQAARIARRFEALLATRVSWKDILQEERSALLFQMKPLLEKKVHEDLRQKKLLQAIADDRYEYHFSDDGPTPTLRGPIINWVLRRQSNEFARGMEAALESAAKPWSRRHLILPADFDRHMAKLIHLNAGARFHFNRADAFQQMTLARLALHAYRKEKGQYPATLDTLVPSYLTKVPADPFADGRPLRYRKAGRSFKLWSVGPDGRDNNAQPTINPKSRRPSTVYMVVESGLGDMVAGISR